MNLYDKSSLILVPGAVKDGKVYSQRPENGSGDFTFTRASSATRVDKNGLIEKGRENLLLQSNQFDTTWYNTTSSETGGQIGYDGSNDAWELSISAAAGRLTQSISLGGVQTFSVYAKAGTYNFLDLYALGNVAHAAYFDLSTGSVGTTFSLIDSSITSVGNGWYKCSITFSDTTLNVRFYPAVADNDLTGTSGSIYIQDAQLEVGLVATDYIETTTTTAVSGITEDLPRLDYSSGASCPSLLLEPQRTNSYISSEYISGINSRLTQTISNIDSCILGVKFLKIERNQTGIARLALSGSTNGDIDTFSVFAKKGSLGGNILWFSDNFYGLSTISAKFDLSIGDWESTPSGTALIDYGYEDFGNGIYRIWASGISYDISNPDSTKWRNPAIFLDALGVNEYIYLTGIQAEKNSSYPTSYIPTYGSAVTRVVDWCRNNSATSLIGQTEGTLFLDLNVTTIDENSFLFGIYGGGNEIYFRGSTLNKIGFVHYFGGAVANIPTTTLSEGRYKLAACYKNNDWVLYLNGSLVGTDPSGTFSGGSINNVTLGYISIGAYPPFESVNQAILFPTRLSNEELADLTTL